MGKILEFELIYSGCARTMCVQMEWRKKRQRPTCVSFNICSSFWFFFSILSSALYFYMPFCEHKLCVGIMLHCIDHKIPL